MNIIKNAEYIFSEVVTQRFDQELLHRRTQPGHAQKQGRHEVLRPNQHRA